MRIGSNSKSLNLCVFLVRRRQFVFGIGDNPKTFSLSVSGASLARF